MHVCLFDWAEASGLTGIRALVVVDGVGRALLITSTITRNHHADSLKVFGKWPHVCLCPKCERVMSTARQGCLPPTVPLSTPSLPLAYLTFVSRG